MKTGIRTDLVQSQKLLMTQQLRQSIEMLQLTNLELSHRIETEVMENPMLEMSEMGERPDDLARLRQDSKTDGEFDRAQQGKQDLEWENSFNNLDYSSSNSAQNQEASDRFQSFLEGAISQEIHVKDLLEEQSHLLFDEGKELDIALLIISSLNEKGFLEEDPHKLAEDAGYKDKGLVSAILHEIQHFEPVGLATVNSIDSLKIQAKVKFRDNDEIHRILELFSEQGSDLEPDKIAAKLSLSIEEIEAALSKISQLNPYPAAQYSTEKTKYIVPDVFVYVLGEEIIIELNDQWMPKVHINEEYQRMIQKGGREPNTDLNKEDQNYLAKKLNSAIWLIKGIEQRRKTLYQVMRAIIEKQEDFFRKGPGHLNALSLQDIADMISLHKSNVSRTVNGKYVETAWGIFELKQFFVRSIATKDGELIATNSLRDMIKKLIDEEDNTVLSDQEIANRLSVGGYDLARRTVAKYREELGIPSSAGRKRIKSGKTKRI